MDINHNHFSFGNLIEMTQDVDFCIIACPNICADFYVLFSKLKKLNIDYGHDKMNNMFIV
jgi:hypothetical protein